MSKQTCQSSKWAAYIIFFLLTSLTSDGAILHSGTTLTSSSASATANQRSTRSAEDLDRVERDIEDTDIDDCSRDFVGKFYDVLESPVGKEAEALLATVLKLLSENDRMNLLSITDSDSECADTLPQPQQHLTSKRRPQHHPNSDPDSLKRRLPKFNPTGWRRKRATYASRYGLQRFLRGVLTRITMSGQREEPKRPEDDVDPKIAEWENKKRESLRRVLQRLPKELKPKRRPLEFNPTGW